MKKILISVVAAACLCASVFAEDATEIMKKSTTLPVPDFSETVLSMDLIDKSGKVIEHRLINQFGNHKNGVTSTVFDIRTPANVKDTRILQAEKIGKSDDKWIFLPSLKTTRRIATQERKKSWVGSEFTYNDMTIRKYDDDAHEMLDENATEKLSSGKTLSCYKIKSVPVKNKNVEFAYRIQYIDKESFLPVFIEFYDKSGNMIKTYRIEEIEQVKGTTGKTYWLRKSNIVKNLKTGEATRVAAEKVTFDKSISDHYFTQNWLNTGK